MKKSMVLSICGIVLAFMTLQVISNKKNYYVKKVYHTDKKEAVYDFIGYNNVYENLNKPDLYSNTLAKEYFESISLRYRIYIKNSEWVNHPFGFLPFIIDGYSLEEVEDDYIKKAYEDTFKLLKEYEKGKDVTFYKLKGEGLSFYEHVNKNKINENGSIKLEEVTDKYQEYYKEEIEMYLVVVNEGQGFVVDYYERVH